MYHVIPTLPCSNVLFFINDTFWVMNRVRSDSVITCIGSRVHDNVLQFGQNHQTGFVSSGKPIELSKLMSVSIFQPNSYGFSCLRSILIVRHNTV